MSGKNSNSGDQFAQYAAAVARDLYGEPNKQLSKPDDLRFGTHGSLSVVPSTGAFFDHSEGVGGGVLWAIERETGQTVEGGKAVQWMRDNGYYIEDRAAPSRPGGTAASANGVAGKQARYDRHGNYLPKQVPDHGELTKVYDYRDADGNVRYQVVRFDWDDPESEKGHSKTFTQRAPDPSRKDGWTYKVQGIEPLPYRLPELLEDIADGAEIFIVEGEKKADLLREIGVPATCNTGGAGKFPEAIIPFFRGAKVTILPDNDPQSKRKDGSLAFHADGRPVLPGQDHARMVGGKLLGVAERVRILELPGLPLKGGVDDWLPAGGTAEQLYELAQTASRPANAVAYESKFAAVDWLDLDAPGPQHEWLIKKVLTRGEVSMLAGASQSGKTFLALDQALAVARGIDWFGHRVLQGGVLYCASESAVGVRRKRLPAYRRHYQVGAQSLPFTLIQKPLDLYSSDEHVDGLIEEAAHWAREYERIHGVKLELIVIDTLSAVTPGWDENSSRDVGPVLARCARLRDATGAHVMLVHHLNAEGTKARGHTSIFANIENVMIVRKDENSHDADNRLVREMIITKQKEEEDGEKFRFVLPAIQIGQDADGDKVTSCIVAAPAGEAGQPILNPTAITLGGANQKALRALYEVLADGALGVFAPPELKLRSGALVARRQDHIARFYAIEKPEDYADKSPEEQKKIEDAARQAIKRARDTLYQKGIIGMSEEWIWLTGKPVQGFGPPPGEARSRRRAAEPQEQATPGPDALPFSDDDLEGL